MINISSYILYTNWHSTNVTSIYFILPTPESSPTPYLCQLITAAQSYFDQGISAATEKAYETGLNKYLAFCIQCKQQTIPAYEDTLVLFVTHLTNQQLSHATIQVYLSAVHYLHIANKEYHTFTAYVNPQLGQVIKDIQRTYALTHSPNEWHPITFPIMIRIHSLQSNQADKYYNLMIWATCCTAYLGLLRVSEFTALSPNHSNSFTDLLLSDTAIDSHAAPQVIRITLNSQRPISTGRAHTFTWL